ncbi:hypothetical protein OG870_17280 [Streptomyces sp. NBC_00461]|uniref:hypothetical protein n=1 Tax=Streptomyces sp. NBC_00461 TaxID=2975750 RepID=UPI002E18CC1A
MNLRLEVHLTDAVGQTPEGGGSWRAIVKDGNTLRHDTGVLPYQGNTWTADLPISATWTHASLQLDPDRYAAQGVQVNPSAGGVYRNNSAARIVLDGGNTRLRLDLPLLRIREAPGVQIPSTPKPGDDPKAAWLTTSKSQTRAISLRYREVNVNDWPNARKTRMVTPGPAPSAVLDDPDHPDWGRLHHQDRSSDPSTAGAPLVLEYGEVGRTSATEPRFLVGIWAPAPAGSSAVPAWRDMVAFYHPSTAKTWFPADTYPFRNHYPYPVSSNTQVDPSHPDRLFQPYVNLALKYMFGHWSHFVDKDRQLVLVTPILPHPLPGPNPAKPSRDENEYGLPFRAQSGLARLLTEVNLFLHQRRYGWSGTNLDDWWGARAPMGQPRSPAEVPTFFLDERAAPQVRRVAVAAFSSSSQLLEAALTTKDLPSAARYTGRNWGVPDVRKALLEPWMETWCLDPLLGKTTVQAPVFEKNLMKWWSESESRRFLLANSGTTGGSNPGALYPAIRTASSALRKRSKSDPNRNAEAWWGPNQRWIGMFCSNPYLSAVADVLVPWPPFTAHPSSDDAHAFMHVLAVGLALGWSTLGRP